MNNKKVAFVIGHHKKAKGAYSKILGVSEWIFWQDIYEETLKDIGDLFIHDEGINSYTQRQLKMGKRTSEYDIVFELHFNAYDSKASGAFALYYKHNIVAKDLARVFQEQMVEKFNIRSLHNKAVDKKHDVRGAKFILKTKNTALLLEPFFGDNADDVHKFLKNQEKFADVIMNVIKYM